MRFYPTLFLTLLMAPSGTALAQDDGGGIDDLLGSIPEIVEEKPVDEEPKPPPEITFPQYTAAVSATVLASWSPKKSALKDARAQTQLGVKIDDNGQITDIRAIKLSGSKKFDQSCLDAINAAGGFEPPPPPLRDAAADGVVVTFSAAWALKRG